MLCSRLLFFNGRPQIPRVAVLLPKFTDEQLRQAERRKLESRFWVRETVTIHAHLCLFMSLYEL